MRRWLVIAMLFLVLPFQFVWAAAAPYCAHETQPEAAKHFGHHEHQHQGGNQSEAATFKLGDTSGTAHADCESCHLSSGATLQTQHGVVADAPRHGVVDYQQPVYRSHKPRGPERPDIADLTLAARFGGGVVSGFSSPA